jgi:hypothetical protein
MAALVDHESLNITLVNPFDSQRRQALGKTTIASADPPLSSQPSYLPKFPLPDEARLQPQGLVFGIVSSIADTFSLSSALIHRTRTLASRPKAMGQRASSHVLQIGESLFYSGRRPLLYPKRFRYAGPNSQRLGIPINLISDRRTSSMLDLLRQGCPSSPGS